MLAMFSATTSISWKLVDDAEHAARRGDRGEAEAERQSAATTLRKTSSSTISSSGAAISSACVSALTDSLCTPAPTSG